MYIKQPKYILNQHSKHYKSSFTHLGNNLKRQILPASLYCPNTKSPGSQAAADPICVPSSP